MSISIATMGKFNGWCMKAGAPPYRQDNEEIVKPRVIVSSVEIETKDSLEDYLDKIKVKLISIDD